MPDWVADEDKWEKAKKIASDQGHSDEYDYITGIYKQMGGKIKSSENYYQEKFSMSMIKEFVKKIIDNPIKATIAAILIAQILKKSK